MITPLSSTLIGGILVPLKLFANGIEEEKVYDVTRKNALGKSVTTGRVTCSFKLNPPIRGYEGTQKVHIPSPFPTDFVAF